MNGPAVLANDLVRDGESQAGARPDLLGRKHGIEDVRQGLARHSRARVSHFHGYLAWVTVGRRSQPDTKLPSPGHGVRAVIDQVQENLVQVAGIAVNLRTAFGQIHLHADLAQIQDRRGKQEGVFQHAPQVQPLQAQLVLARPREQLLHRAHNVFHLLSDNLEAVGGGFVIARAPRQQLHVPKDGIEGCADFVRQAGGELPGHRQALRARQRLLGLEKLFVDALQLLVPLCQFHRSFFHLAAQFGIEILQAPQHAVQVGGEQSNLIPTPQRGAHVKLPALRRLHDTDHFLNRPPHRAQEEKMDHEENESQAGQHQQSVLPYQSPRHHAGLRFGNLQVQATHRHTLVANGQAHDPELTVWGLDRQLVVIGSLKFVVGVDVRNVIQLEVRHLWLRRSFQLMHRFVEVYVSLSHARQVAQQLAEGYLEALGALQHVFIYQLVCRSPCLSQYLAVDFLLHQLPGEEHRNQGGNGRDRNDGNGNNDDNLSLQAKTRTFHDTTSSHSNIQCGKKEH